jgi:Tfp pilus assembly protein PilP
MKLTTGILAMAMMVGGAVGQNPDAIDNARSVAKSLQQQATDGKAPAAKPAPGAPSPAVKPAVIPGASTSSAPAAKPVAKAPAPKATTASAQHNQLQHVNVVPGSNDIQIEISSSAAVTPNVSKLSSPERVLVELPDTVVATAQSKIPVGSSGVKRVRIGMDGKTPPTTSVVVDLEKAIAFDLAPGPAGKVVLILHTQEAGSATAKNTPVPAAKAPAVVGKNSAPAPKNAVPAPPAAAKPVVVAGPAGKAPTPAPTSKNPAPAVAPQVAGKAVAAPKVADAKTPSPFAKPAAAPAVKADGKQAGKTTVVAAKPTPTVAAPAPVKTVEAPKPPKPEEKKWAMTGKRDPFFSPVVQQQGSGCSTGKKCLEIGTINLRGVVKSDSGFIAVVTNNLGKAYFLRENDPVFNGYVVKITGDSVTFQETIQDKLGKSFTREVVKRIFTPAV